ncbi:DoxX [Posidoniimonas polymericola]|uniref:DoxX n=1 Tax=Posidoniimonas polymericola TaxID=2528002 RepID=A0A5C5XSW6_9BACT|nr:DoxX family protein [Posidoniimonas polymericola]TWT66346.1 DoxX [Posidoniimonas polymericola]
MTKAQLGGATVLCIVLMRLAAGYHFFSEGMKKFDPNYVKVTEGFLRGATGPLADQFHSLAPGPHQVYELLAEPKKWDSLAEEEQAEINKWQGEYSAYLAEVRKKNAEIEKKNKAEETNNPLELVDTQFPPRGSYSKWANQIAADWQDQLDAFASEASLDDEQSERARRAYLRAKIKLGQYFEDTAEEIEEYQHELWRLEELKAEVQNEGGTLPYIDDRIAQQEAEANTAPRPWISEVAAIEDRYHGELRDLAADADPTEVNEALNPPSELSRVNAIVTWVVVGSGALLFLGLFTRVAAVVAAGFLLSVIVTQPPWVYGANTQYFFYQLFEVTGLLTLAAVGAGRWLGIDGLLGACCCSGGRSGDQNKNS